MIYSPFGFLEMKNIVKHVKSYKENSKNWQCKGINCPTCGTVHARCAYYTLGGFEISEYCYLKNDYIENMLICPHNGKEIIKE